MSVYRNDGKWRAEVFAGGKKVCQRSGFDRKEDARRWQEETLARYRKSPESIAPSKKIYFEELLEKFESNHLPKVRESTRDRYLVDIKQRIAPYFQYMDLSKIDGALIDSFQSSLIGKDLKPKSINNCMHTLRLILNKGEKWKLLTKSPYECDSLKVPKSNKDLWWDNKRFIQDFLSEAEKRSRYYVAFVLALETGMRLGEIVGLSKQDVDFERGRIRVWRQWSDVYQRFGPCKFDIERWIDFDTEGRLSRVLREVVARSPDQSAIFVTATGRRVTNRALAERYFKNIVRWAKVPPISFHGLRHTFASWYMIEVDDIWALKKILGHADIQTTHRYAHHSSRQRLTPLNLTEFEALTPISPRKLELV